MDRLKRRARAHNRSLQGELKEILTIISTEGYEAADPVEQARRVRERIRSNRGTFETDSADLIRSDRDSR